MKNLTIHKTRRDIEIETHISLKHSYIYYQVSKAANSTIKYHLQNLEFEGTSFKINNVNNKHLSPHLSPYQLPKSVFLNMMRSKDVVNFTFVRNPYARLLSCYLHRILREPNSPSSNKFSLLANGRRGAEVTFNDFVERICEQESSDMESHWRVQYDCIMYPHVGWSYIGRVENLMPDLERVFDLIRNRSKMEYFPSMENSKVNASPMKTSADEKLREYVTPSLQKRIADRYHLDFETFGYEKDL